MRATFTDEQRALADTVRALTARGTADARALLEGGDAAPDLTEMLFAGFTGVGVAESAGGFGGGLVDLAILLEGLGRTVAPTPFVSHVLAVQAAHGAGIDVAGALDGSQRWCLAVEERDADLDDPRTTARDGTVTGSKVAVRDGLEATAAVATVAGDGVVAVAPASRTARPGLDPTRPLADLTLDGPATARGAGARAAVLRAAAGLAAEQVGVGRGALDLAVAYAKTREQFGQPIGRFQAVGHQLADAFVGLELAWSLVLYACWAVDDDHPEAAAAVHRAKAKAGEAAVFAAERGMQVHGGIGITWEADPHLFLRRAVADDAWLGTARRHRRGLGAALVAGAAG
jgi:alkylation response protein AidB-like acyl-CoA dehydrogenase